jgi:hypothetical protein
MAENRSLILAYFPASEPSPILLQLSNEVLHAALTSNYAYVPDGQALASLQLYFPDSSPEDLLDHIEIYLDGISLACEFGTEDDRESEGEREEGAESSDIREDSKNTVVRIQDQNNTPS